MRRLLAQRAARKDACANFCEAATFLSFLSCRKTVGAVVVIGWRGKRWKASDKTFQQCRREENNGSEKGRINAS